MLVVNRKAGFPPVSVPILYHYPMSPYSGEVASYDGASGDAMDVCSGGCVPSTRGAGGISGGLPSYPRLAELARIYCDTRLAFAALMGMNRVI